MLIILGKIRSVRFESNLDEMEAEATLDLAAKLRDETDEDGQEKDDHHKKRHSSASSATFNPISTARDRKKSVFHEMVSQDPEYAKYLSDKSKAMGQVKRHRRKFKMEDPLAKPMEEQ